MTYHHFETLNGLTTQNRYDIFCKDKYFFKKLDVAQFAFWRMHKMSKSKQMILVPKGGRPAKPVPDDLMSIQSTMTRAELAVHYGVSVATINRWIKKSKSSEVTNNGKAI